MDEPCYHLHTTCDSDLNKREFTPGEQVHIAASRSQLGYSINFMGASLETASKRQHSTAIDTAAAELYAASTATSALLNVRGTAAFLSWNVIGTQPTDVYCDNDAAVLICKDMTSIKRVAYVARRSSRFAKFMQELASADMPEQHISA